MGEILDKIHLVLTIQEPTNPMVLTRPLPWSAHLLAMEP
ncbi:MAG: hypothetical protein ACJAVJ_000113 [Planctomycetota bacterium]|jgi:hypothetical protein